MANFIQKMFITAKVNTHKTKILRVFFLLSGGYLGYLKSRKQAQIANEGVIQNNIQQYQNEDQVNQVIDQTNKPAVIYYYQPAIPYHYSLRHAMIKSSNIYDKNATFWMVNLTKKLYQAKEEIQMNFPLDAFLVEIRFPKAMCQVKYSNEDTIEQNARRRQFFKHQYRDESGIYDFLEQNGIKQPDDPMKPFFNICKNSIFKQ